MRSNTTNPYVAANEAVIQAQEKFQQALLLHNLGQLTQAKVLYEETLKIFPKHFDALHLLGVVASQTRNFQIAVELMNKAIEINPNIAEVYSNRGVALKDLKEFDAALASYDKAIALRPNYAEAYNNRGNVFKILKQFDSALANYDKAIALKPDYPEAYNNRGNTLKDLRQFDEALASFDKAIALKSRYPEAYNNRGNTLKDLRQFDEALASFDKAIDLKPDYAGAYNNRGITLTVLNQFNSALASFDKAIALKPRYAKAYNNRGNVLKDHKQFDPALASYDEAIFFEPNYAEAHWNKSLLLLLLGEFHKGWNEFEWRWRWSDFPSPKRNFTQPLWVGKGSLAGKTILLHSEQGLGDAIQFSRYATMVSALGARVILEAGKPLLSLFSTLSGVSQWVERGSPLPSFDFHCPLLSLPLAFKTQMDSIPSSVPYLFSDPEKVSRWQSRLGAKYKPRVGIVWSGSPTHKNDRNRSILLSQLIKHLPDDCLYVSLQKEVRDTDKDVLGYRNDILHYGSELNDFSDTAALCELMDIVISVDTSVAHLAGALGKEVWILLPYVPDWRWLLDRNDSPWYPTAKLYRQEVIGDWTEY
jgi:tetratricopeptide (TPR) repeat protein